jgi:hypothetical protein
MKKNSFVSVILVCAAVLLAGAAGYFYFQNRQVRDDAQLLQTERDSLQERAAVLEQEIKQLETRLRDDEEPAPAKEVLREALGPDNGTRQLPDALTGGSVQARVMNFFRYLDLKGYAARRGLQVSSQEIFMRALQQLEATRPLASGETQDMLALMKNVTFFYRILGKETLLTIKDIVEGEASIMEPVMAIFYEWLNPWKPQATAPRLSREMLYDYAGFFLQSMAGQSYLFRRESGIRMLTLYYSILVLDQANRDELNVNGIDISPPLEALMQDMRYSRRLAERHRYMETLREIQGRY